MLFSEREPSPSKYKYKRFGNETVNLYNCRSLSDCSFVHVTHAQLLFSSVFATFARSSPREAMLVNNLESLWEELVDGVFYTEIWSANGSIMLYLSNGLRDQKQAKILLLPKSLSKTVWWTRYHGKSVSCHGDVESSNSGYSKSNNPLELLFSLRWRQPGNISSE